jgi:hypothetical protein
MDSKAYQPTQATDENGNDRGTFESPFLAQARAEQEAVWGTTNGNWTFTPTDLY